jgi:tRNA(fMet)-specific endonuclease VapC
MKILLETDICIHLIRRRAPDTLRRLKRYAPGDVGISSITLAELAFGVSKSQQPEKNQAALHEFTLPLEVAPFDEAAANTYGAVRAELERSGYVIGPLDMLIGAHALSLGVTLVTHNTREFSRIAGLRLVDWVAGSGGGSKRTIADRT